MTNKSGTVFCYQSGPFSEVVAHDNGYIYGRLVSDRMWVRLDRPQRGPEWQERRLIAEWAEAGSEAP